MTATTETFDPLSDEFALEKIGRFVLEFASIESVTFAAIRTLDREYVAAPVALDLARRIERLGAICDHYGTPTAQQFQLVLQRIRTLASKRNLIVRNPFGPDIHVDSGEPVIVNARKGPEQLAKASAADRVSIDNVVRHRRAAGLLAHDAAVALTALLQELAATNNGKRSASGGCENR